MEEITKQEFYNAYHIVSMYQSQQARKLAKIRGEIDFFDKSIEASENIEIVKITECGLTKRTENSLIRGGIKDTAQLCGLTWRQLRRFKDMGRISLQSIAEYLTSRGIELKE